MFTASQMGEAEDDSPAWRWLSMERIGLSSFMNFVAFENKAFWGQHPDDRYMERWVIMALDLFLCGQCYSLAVGAALEVDLPVLVLRRRGDRGLDQIIHAAVYSPSSELAADILGERPVQALVEEIRDSFGPLAIELVSPVALDMADDHEIMATIAAGLPWMPRKPECEPTPFSTLVRLIDDHYGLTSGDRRSMFTD